MIHPIHLYGDPMLNQKSMDIPTNFPLNQLHDLINDMYETMHKANGIGLSAIQIGFPFRIFIIEAKKDNFHIRKEFINPVIKSTKGSIKFSEGCLSVPGLTSTVERPESIVISYLDKNLNTVEESFDGIAARIIQHEYDHLEGLLFIDIINFMWKQALEPSLQSIKRREIEVSYMYK